MDAFLLDAGCTLFYPPPAYNLVELIVQLPRCLIAWILYVIAWSVATGVLILVAVCACLVVMDPYMWKRRFY